MSRALFLVSAISVLSLASAWLGPHEPPFEPQERGCDPGKPLFLTPYIDSGNAAEGRNLSRNHLPNNFLADVNSYSGFFTVNKSDGGNLFFWHFEHPRKDAPLLIWLQGGPGASSLYGLFVENGPIRVDKNGMAYKPTAPAWSDEFHTLYIDSPVGTGFSFTGSDAGYSTNEVEVGANLLELIEQFYKVYPARLRNDLYITGESYAGKMIPAMAHAIHERNAAASLGDAHIPLKGMAIGDGFTDPENLVPAYPSLSVDFSMVDRKHEALMKVLTDQMVANIKAKKFVEAAQGWFALQPLISAQSGGISLYNMLRSEDPADMGYYSKYLARCDVRRAAHVGNVTYGGGGAVFSHMIHDFMDTVRQWMPTLLVNYRTMLFSGQVDWIVGVPLTENFLDKLEWANKTAYSTAPRHVYRIPGEESKVAGYVKQVGTQFYYVIIRQAGHMVPYDQPYRGFDMIKRFVYAKPFPQ